MKTRYFLVPLALFGLFLHLLFGVPVAPLSGGERFLSGRLGEDARFFLRYENVKDPFPESVRESERSDYTVSLLSELPGTYLLVSLSSREFPVTDELLSLLHRRGFPLSLTLREDGSAELDVFDQQTSLHCDAASLLFRTEDASIPFFYLDGRLTVLENTDRMVFEIISG